MNELDDDDTAAFPPPCLRDRMLEAAFVRRPARARPPVPNGGAATAVEAFARTVDELDKVLDDLDPNGWQRLTIEGWRVRDLVAHLIAIEEYFGGQLSLWPATVDPDLEHDHIALTRSTVDRLSGADPSSLVERWRRSAFGVRTHALSLDGDADSMRGAVRFHALQLPLSTVLIVRTFELWTHMEDICRAVGRPPVVPDAGRFALMTHVAVRSLPLGLAVAGTPLPGRTARIVLTGAGGGTWDQALGLGERAGEPDVCIVADTVEYCRLAAKRLDPAAIEVHVEGDVSLVPAILNGAAVFAA